MEILITIVSVILTALIGVLISSIRQLSTTIGVLKDEINDLKVVNAGSSVACKATHERINDQLSNHEGRIQKLEDPVKKNRKRR